MSFLLPHTPSNYVDVDGFFVWCGKEIISNYQLYEIEIILR